MSLCIISMSWIPELRATEHLRHKIVQSTVWGSARIEQAAHILVKTKTESLDTVTSIEPMHCVALEQVAHILAKTKTRVPWHCDTSIEPCIIIWNTHVVFVSYECSFASDHKFVKVNTPELTLNLIALTIH